MFRKDAEYTSINVGRPQSTQLCILALIGKWSGDATNIRVSFFVAACNFSINIFVKVTKVEGVVGLLPDV